MDYMKITFFSNFLNHHQLPFCIEMQKRLGDNFKFVATEKVPEDRLALGYDDMNKKYDFVVCAYENESEAYKLAIDSDVVIIGSAPEKFIKPRLGMKKITFRYSERVFKSGFDIKVWLSLIKKHLLTERKNVYLLCSSAYAAYDYNISGIFKNKCLKWGYFPEVIEYDIKKLISKKNKTNKISILWVGRFLDWKHPEKVIEVAKKLKDEKIDFSITMIGIGPEIENIECMITNYHLEKQIKLIGAVNNKKIRQYMEEANIYLFTSDFNEGWGAVLNEAMNSGCAVVASHAIGSVPFLIKHKQNGLIYKDNNLQSLYNNVILLIKNKKLREKIGKNAYNTLKKDWNAKNAAVRIIKLSIDLKQKNKLVLPENNICSKALAISNKKMYDHLMRCEYDD